MKILLNGLTGLLLFLAPLHTSRLMADETAEGSWYLGAGLGVSRLNPDTSGTPFSVADDSSNGYKLTLGYDWSERVSVEAYYTDMGEAVIAPRGRIEYQDFGFTGLYHFYQQERPHQGLELSAKLGLGYMKNDSDLNYERINDGHVMLGLELGYGLANGFMLRADIDLFDKDSQLFTINLIKRFGGKKPVTQEAEEARKVERVEAQPQTVMPIVVEPVTLEDEDGDGVEDGRDDCPGTAVGMEIDRQGCPLSWILQGVNFEHASAILTPEAKVMLDQVATQLNKQKTGRQIRVLGHTDDLGPAAYNQRLSQQRADAVLDYLLARGVASAMLSAAGRGELEPIADNATEQGRAKNRRVELRWE